MRLERTPTYEGRRISQATKTPLSLSAYPNPHASPLAQRARKAETGPDAVLKLAQRTRRTTATRTAAGPPAPGRASGVQTATPETSSSGGPKAPGLCGLAAGKPLASKICTPVCPERLKAVPGSPFGRIERQFWAQPSSAKVRGSPKKRCTQALQRSERAVISRRTAHKSLRCKKLSSRRRSQIF